MRQLLEQFKHFDRAAIDSSSVIYMEKAGFFDVFKNIVDVYTVPEVIDEIFASSEKNFEKQRCLDDLNIKICPIIDEGITVDEKVLRCAQKNSCEVVSEDKKVLRAAARQGVPYFNALVVLHFLLFRQAIDEAEYQSCMTTLFKFARYGPDVIQRGQEIYEAVMINKDRKDLGEF